MEGNNIVKFSRLLSEESRHSSLSLDSSENYQAKIFHQLPSVQASRPDQTLRCFKVYQGGPEPMVNISHSLRSRRPKDKESTQPFRNLVMCIQGKRDVRRKIKISNTGFWESWNQSQSFNGRRVLAQMRGALSNMLPWHHTLHVIEGRFGVGVKTYFVFLRYLVFLNLLHSALIWSFILGPTIFFGRSNSSEPLKFEGNDSVLDFFLGSGYLERSPVFFGFYSRGSLNFSCLNSPLLYLAGIFSILFVSLIRVVRRTIVGYKHTWMLGRRDSMNVSYKIFCGWDFNIQHPLSATLKHSFIRNDLKLLLEEQSFSLREDQRTVGQRVRVYLFRFILNLFILSLLAGAFYLIYFATKTTQNESGHHWLISLVLQYLPPITITFVNLFLPHLFRKISTFEDYSFTMQVNATLVRSAFLKQASLGIYLYFVFSTAECQHQQCWENRFGREIYKLCIFSFLASFCMTFLLDYPRKLVWERCPSSWLARSLGEQRFQIPFNVLDLVYSQTVFWVGVYYCPLLPLIGTVTLMATFYFKKFTVLRCCVSEQRIFRASSSSVLFHFMLLLGLLMAVVTLVLNFYQQDLTSDSKISSCGPFGNGETVFNVTGVCVDSLPKALQTTLRYLASEAFAFPLILAEFVLLTSYVSRVRANQRAIKRLEAMLITCSSDKHFLVKTHATILRSRRKTRRLSSAAIIGDTPRQLQPDSSPQAVRPDSPQISTEV